MSQFIGYSIDGTSENSVPVAVGADKEACMALTIRRTLSAGCIVGSICVQQRDEIEPAIFEQLRGVLDQFFHERGIL